MNKRGVSVKQTVKQIIKYILLALVILLTLLTVWNYICKIIGKLQRENVYGRKITVDGKTMVVDVTGNEDRPSLILLPGWGCASPVLEFHPLAKRLSEDFQVITIEPFGYGLSDGTDKERTAENIVQELHDCVKQLGCREYYLMGHSIAGLYALYWANQYPDEVKGFIGIDPSVPKMEDENPFPISMVTLNKLSAYAGKAMNLMGITRLKSIRNPRKAIYADEEYPYSDKDLKVFRLLSIDTAYNKTVLGELNFMEGNLRKVRNLKFPKDMPVLEFISEDNCKMMPAWEQLHKDTIGTGEVIRMSGGHYLHFEHPDEIAKKVKGWIHKMEPSELIK